MPHAAPNSSTPTTGSPQSGQRSSNALGHRVVVCTQSEAVAPFMAEAVGEVGRPRADAPRRGELAHLPGNRSFFDFLSAMHGVITRGNAYYIEHIGRHGPIYAQQDGEGIGVFVAEPRAIAEIAKNEDGIWSTALAWRAIFDGVPPSDTLDFPTALDFDHHVQARRLLTPAFSAAALDGYAALVAPLFSEAIDGFLDQGQVSFKAEARRLFSQAGAKIFMGIDDKALARHMEGALVDVWGSFQIIFKSEWLSPKFRRARRGYRTLLETFRSLVSERASGKGTDLFSRLCQEHAGPEWMDNETIVRLYIGVMTAAFDTTAFGVTNVAYLLATHPEWQERLREQGAGVSLHQPDRELPKKLPEFEWTFKEGLRRYPVAAALLRRSLRDCEILGYKIPAGTPVFPLTAPVLWDEKYFPNPLAFDPLRFSPERNEPAQLGAAFMPFGAGAHLCVGQLLATLEATIFWHQMLARCRFRLARPYEAKHQMSPLGTVSGKVDLIVEPV